MNLDKLSNEQIIKKLEDLLLKDGYTKQEVESFTNFKVINKEELKKLLLNQNNEFIIYKGEMNEAIEQHHQDSAIFPQW